MLAEYQQLEYVQCNMNRLDNLVDFVGTSVKYGV